MRPVFFLTAVIVAATLTMELPAAPAASGGIGFNGIVERVVFEPSETNAGSHAAVVNRFARR